MRTLEEIADWLHEAVTKPGAKMRKPNGLNRDFIMAALRETVAARDAEMREQFLADRDVAKAIAERDNDMRYRGQAEAFNEVVEWLEVPGKDQA